MAAAAAWMGWLGVAQAQAPAPAPTLPAVSVQRFRPSVHGGPYLTVDPAGGGGARLRGTGVVLAHWAANPLVYRDAAGDERGLVTDVLQLDVAGAIGWGPVRAGLIVPAVLFEQGAGQRAAGLGDLGVDARVRIGPGLAAAGRLTAPTSTLGDAALGAGAATGELTAVAERPIGPVGLAANLGAAFGPTRALEGVTVGDAGIVRLGAAWPADPGAAYGAAVELGARVGLPADGAPGSTWAEWLGSGWAGLGGGLALRAGVGTGLTRGVGAPAIRAVLGVTTTQLGGPRQVAAAPAADPGVVDGDGDGISDLHDACGAAPEDIDDVGDADGCPEPEVPLDVRIVGPDGAPPAVVRWAVGTTRISGERAALIPGAWEITVDAPGFAPATLPVEVGPGGLRLTVTLEPTTSRIAVDRTRITLREPLELADGTFSAASAAMLDEVAAVLLRHPALDRVRVRAVPEVARTVVAHLVARGVPEARLTVEAGDQPQPELLVDRWAP